MRRIEYHELADGDGIDFGLDDQILGHAIGNEFASVLIFRYTPDASEVGEPQEASDDDKD